MAALVVVVVDLGVVLLRLILAEQQEGHKSVAR
jgi:hypothetical protein